MSIPDLRSLRREQARPWWQRVLRFLLWSGVGLYLAYLPLGFWVLPAVLKDQLQTRGSEKLGRVVQVEKVRYNPLTFSLALEGFRLKEKDASDFVSWRRLFVDFELVSLVRREWRFQEIALEGLQGKIIIDRGGVFNFADLQQKFAGAPTSASVQTEAGSAGIADWPLVVKHLRLDLKPVMFSDFSRPTSFVTALGPVNLDLRDVHTTSAEGAGGEISGVTEAGEKFSWSGSVALKPLSSRGRLELKDFLIPKHSAYYAPVVPFSILSGRLQVATDYEISSAGGKWSFALKNTEATVEQLALAAPASTLPAVKWERIEVRGLKGGTAESHFHVERLALLGGAIDAQRDKKGLNLLALLPDAPATAAPAASAQPGAPAWRFSVGEAAVERLAVQWLDTSNATPVRLKADPVSLSIKNLDTAALSSALPVTLRAALGQEASWSADGTVVLRPLQVRVQTKLTGFALAPLSPYLENARPYQITDGRLGFEAEAALALPAGSAPVYGGKANVTLDDLSLQRAGSGESLARLARLEVNGIEATNEPELRVVVAGVVLEKPEADLIRLADGSLNWAVPAPPAGTAVTLPAPEEPAGSTTAVSLAVDQVEIRNGRLALQDRSVQPAVALSLADLRGSIGGLASANLARAEVDLQGKFDGGAPFSLKGQINPLGDDVFSDITTSWRGLDLLPASPYAAKYVGRRLSRGNASLDLKLKLSRRSLAVEQTLILDQLTLGAAVDSPDATKLPVSLALALLRDRNGRITLEVPIQGNLEDPEFRYGKVVWGVLRNLLEKAATSPFSLLGSMFGGGGDELGWVEFVPGADFLHERGIQKMNTVAAALRDRPGLSLDVMGHQSAEVDRPAYRLALFKRRLQQAYWEELRKANPEGALAAPERLEVPPEVEARLIAQLYRPASAAPVAEGAVPAASTSVSAATPASPTATSTSEESPGFFQRLARFFAANRAEPSVSPQKSRPAGKPLPPVAATPAALPTVEEMRTSLLEQTEVSDDLLLALADRRAQTIRAYLVDKGQVPADRIFLVPSAPGSTRAELTLK